MNILGSSKGIFSQYWSRLWKNESWAFYKRILPADQPPRVHGDARGQFWLKTHPAKKGECHTVWDKWLNKLIGTDKTYLKGDRCKVRCDSSPVARACRRAVPCWAFAFGGRNAASSLHVQIVKMSKTGLRWEGEAGDSLSPPENASQPDLGAPSVYFIQKKTKGWLGVCTR